MIAALRRHSELIQADGIEARETLGVGCWVVVAAPELDRPLLLGCIESGPSYEHFDGHATGEVWTLTDGSRHPVGALTLVDIAGITREGTALAAEIRSAGPSKDRDITGLRVHRAACLARALLARGPAQTRITDEACGQIFLLVCADNDVTQAEESWREFTRTSLPRLLSNLHDAGALWLAAQPGWTPGNASVPHPRWRDK